MRLLAVLVPVSIVLYACSESGSELEAPVTAADAGGKDDVRTIPSADASSVPTSPLVPPGWRHFGEYNASCELFVPETPEAFPPPVRWQPCINDYGDAGLSGPAGMVCRQAASDWNPDPNSFRQLTSGAVVLPDQRVVLIQRRVIEPRVFVDVVAEADGRVLSAIMSTGACLTFGPTISQTHYLYQIRESFDDPDAPSGLIGGEVSPPSVLRVLKASASKPAGITTTPTFVVGKSTYLEQTGGGDTLRSLSTSDVVTHPGNGEPGLQAVEYQFVDDHLFWRAASSTRSVIKVRPSNGEVVTLIDHGADESLSAFATDGVDMVWTRASGRASADRYGSYEMWTATFSTEPIGFDKRRLFAVEPSSWDTRRVVGCGYVAHQLYGHAEPYPQMGFRLIRLADGRTWDVLSNSAEQTASFRFEQPHAITCDEIFVDAYRGSNGFLTRIKISSLGPGIARQ